MRFPRWWRLSGVIAFMAMLAAPALPGAAGSRVLAHAQLIASSPGAGAIVAESPAELRLIFSEVLEAQVTSLDVVAQDGTSILRAAGEIDPEDPYALVVVAPKLADGIYSLTWRTLSTVDGHTAEGSFTFGVGAGQEAPPQAAGGGMTHTETDAIGVIGRWLTYLGLLLALGVAVFHRVVIREGFLPMRLIRLLAAGMAISAAATMAVAVASGLEAGSVPDYLLGTRNGGLQLARATVAALGAGVLLVAPARLSGLVAAASGLVGIILLIVSGHAAALPGPGPVIGGVVHVAGAAVWIGGLAGLMALILRPSLLTSQVRPLLRTYVPRFSALALVSIGLVGLTGVYSAWLQTGTLVTVETEFGRTLLMKSALAAGAFAMGGLNYLDGGRMLALLNGFRTRLTVESMAAIAVLVMTAALATTPPVEDVRGVAIQPIPDAFGEVTPGMSMEIMPGRPGVNRVVVTTTEAMAAAPAFELSLDRLDEGSTTRVPLTHVGMEGTDHSTMSMESEDGMVDWFADAVVLPAGSQWDTSVRILALDDTELSRQRFAFTLSDDGIDDGRITTLLNPAVAIALVLVLGGALGLGLGLGGMALPRCEALASRLALVGGGVTAVVLGLVIGLGQLTT
ncbi:MAG: copper resistance protein CopC/CopD [Chloroflexi bacterium]|nr:copper resistance protein CopC/CopD [Chloroflexota bacterium]